MNFNELESLIDKINTSDISFFELNIENIYLKMDKSLIRSNQSNTQNTIEEPKEVQKGIKEFSIQSNISTDITDNVIDENLTNQNIKVITSPMVGTFYEAPGVGVDAFVKIGQKVKIGDTLCIIEAMKLMNEIESDISGEIIEILVENGEMVEFGTELFKIRS